jgi:hypothetical protein
MQLPKGIYFEYAPASSSSGPGLHAHLVFRDGKGNERVIRGGLMKESDQGFKDKSTRFMKSLVGGNITVQADIPLQESRDKYGVKKGETAETRHARRLDLGGRDPEQVWKDMTAKANEIAKAGIDYNLIGEKATTRPPPNRVPHNHPRGAP